MMVGNVYSTYEVAKIKAKEKVDELEQDVFICLVKYESGQEFILKTKSELMVGGDFIYQERLSFKHRFKSEENAEREAKKFAANLGKDIRIEKRTFREKGYNKFSHYALCSI